MAATDGIVGSPGLGLIPFAQSAVTFPGVSDPSSVVRSMQRTARSSAQSFDAFLIDRLASEAARSSAPTSSTLRTPRINEPRWVSESAVATTGIMRRGRAVLSDRSYPLYTGSELRALMEIYEDAIAAFRSGATGHAEDFAVEMLSEARDSGDANSQVAGLCM